MKTTLHKISRRILKIFGILILIFFSIFLWRKYAWSNYLDKQEIIELSKQINNSQPLAGRFYEIYDQIYPGQRFVRYSKTYILGGLMFLINSNLPERYVSPIRSIGGMFFLFDNKSMRIRNKKALPIYFSFALEKYSSPEKCFDFYINNFDFLYNSIGLEDACLKYFNKSIDNLTDKEIIGLIVLIENPSFFNPRLHPERYKIKVDVLLKKLIKASA